MDQGDERQAEVADREEAGQHVGNVIQCAGTLRLEDDDPEEEQRDQGRGRVQHLGDVRLLQDCLRLRELGHAVEQRGEADHDQYQYDGAHDRSYRVRGDVRSAEERDTQAKPRERQQQ